MKIVFEYCTVPLRTFRDLQLLATRAAAVNLELDCEREIALPAIMA